MIKDDLISLIQQAAKAAQKAGDLPPFDLPAIIVEQPKNAEHGDYATNVAMQSARPARMAPIKIAEQIVHALAGRALRRQGRRGPARLHQHHPGRRLAGPAGGGDPGQPGHVRQLRRGPGRKAQVEFVSANPTGPLTIGHAWGAVLGDSIASLLQATGWDVTREYYFNNGGRQMRLLGESLQVRCLELLGDYRAIPKDGYQGEYLRWVAAALYAEYGDALGEKDVDFFRSKAVDAIFANIRCTLDRLGIRFDVYYNELELYETGKVNAAVQSLANSGYAYQKDGATWLRATDLGLKQDRVIIKSSRRADLPHARHRLPRGKDAARLRLRGRYLRRGPPRHLA